MLNWRDAKEAGAKLLLIWLVNSPGKRAGSLALALALALN